MSKKAFVEDFEQYPLSEEVFEAIENVQVWAGEVKRQKENGTFRRVSSKRIGQLAGDLVKAIDRKTETNVQAQVWHKKALYNSLKKNTTFKLPALTKDGYVRPRWPTVSEFEGYFMHEMFQHEERTDFAC